MSDPLSYLHAGRDGPRCRIGALFVDLAGKLYALSARHILERAADGAVYDGDGVYFGTVIDSDPPATGGDAGPPFHDLIVRVAVASAAIAAALAEHSKSVGAIAPQINPGQLLTWLNGQGERIDFVVVGYGGEVAFTNPYTLATGYFQDPISLVAREPGRPVPGAGDAGSLLIDAEGRAAALLISADDERYFAASLASYAMRYALKPYFDPPLLASSDHPTPTLPLQINGAHVALAHIREVIAGYEPVHSDPDGENIPVHLLRQLDEVDA